MVTAATFIGIPDDKPNFPVWVVQRTVSSCCCWFLNFNPFPGFDILDGNVGFDILVLLHGGI
jgi:hypothetical protein